MQALFRVSACAAVAGALVVGPAHAESEALAFYSGGLQGLLVDERDQGLLEALRMVDARLEELPQELPEGEGHEVPMLRMIWNLLTGPMAAQLGMTNDDRPMPIIAQLTFLDRTPEQTQALSRSIGTIMQMAGHGEGRPAEGRNGMRVFDTEGVQLFVGRDGDGFVVSVGEPGAPAEPADPGLPRGVRPALSFAYDGPAAQPFFQMALSHLQAEPGADVDTARELLELFGVIGPDAASFSLAVGHGDDRMYGAWRLTNYVPLAERFDALSSEPLSRRDVSIVPADATFMEVGRYPLSRLAEWMTDEGPEGVEELVEQMHEQLDDEMDEFVEEFGVHVQRDVLAHLGDTYGYYMSDTTGGGSFMSSVLFLSVRDPDALSESLRRVARTFNDETAEHADGYVQLRTRRHHGLEVTTLMFPGLPVPIEISCTIASGYLFAGATPHAVLAAAQHAAHGRRSILDNPGFRAMGGDGYRDAICVSYVDTERFARTGYGFVLLGCSALANVVRSARDELRDPGVVCPSFNELVKGAKPIVAVYRIDGNDLVGTSQGDRSILANIAGGLGLLHDSGVAAAGGAVAAGLMLPALEKAQHNAKSVKSAAQIRQLLMALHTFAAENNDRLPRDWHQLVDDGYIPDALLDSPLGPVWDGRGDYWLNTALETFGAIDAPDRTILVYDRAMAGQHANVVIGFADGHVETVHWRELEIRADEEVNRGFDLDMPERRGE